MTFETDSKTLGALKYLSDKLLKKLNAISRVRDLGSNSVGQVGQIDVVTKKSSVNS